MKILLYKNPSPYFIALASSVKTLEVKAIEFHSLAGRGLTQHGFWCGVCWAWSPVLLTLWFLGPVFAAVPRVLLTLWAPSLVIAGPGLVYYWLCVESGVTGPWWQLCVMITVSPVSSSPLILIVFSLMDSLYSSIDSLTTQETHVTTGCRSQLGGYGI